MADGVAQMTEITFTSSIKPVRLSDFALLTVSIPKANFVDYPWTVHESTLARDVYTKNICDCTSCLFTNGKEALLMHLSPENSSNHYFDSVLMFLRNKIDLKDENLQAVLIGSKNTKKSQDIYNKFTNLLNNLGIKFSELKNGKGSTHVAYKTFTDEVYVSNPVIDKALKKNMPKSDALNSGFEKVILSDLDEIV